MTSPGRYATSDGSFARSASGAAARGGVLIAVAVVIGVVLLRQGFDGGDAQAVIPIDDGNDGSQGGPGDVENGDVEGDPDGDVENGDEEGGTRTGDDQPADPPVGDVAVDPPSSVKVAVANGIGEPGLGSGRSDVLLTAGYVSKGVNAAKFDHELSRVYYLPGYEDEAKAVAVVLGGGSSVLDAAPPEPLSLVAESFREAVQDFDIFVILGADGALA